MSLTCASLMPATPIGASTSRRPVGKSGAFRVAPISARPPLAMRRPTSHRGSGLRAAASYERQRAPNEADRRSGNPTALPPVPVRPPVPPPPPPPRKLTWVDRLSSPIVILAAVLALSLANPGYVDRGREYLLLNLYEKQSADRMARPLKNGVKQYNEAVVRDGVLYKYNKFSGSITATSKNGLMVDNEGLIWVVVRYKNNPERVKQAWYIGDSKELPPLPRNANEKQIKQWNALVAKKFGPVFSKLPDLKKIYDAPEPAVSKRNTNAISKELRATNQKLTVPPMD